MMRATTFFGLLVVCGATVSATAATRLMTQTIAEHRDARESGSLTAVVAEGDGVDADAATLPDAASAAAADADEQRKVAEFDVVVRDTAAIASLVAPDRGVSPMVALAPRAVRSSVALDDELTALDWTAAAPTEIEGDPNLVLAMVTE